MSVVEQESTQLEGIAIVGMACRFPGASTPEEFWKNLEQGVESISFFEEEQLDRAAIDPAELRDPKYVKARGVLEGIEQFDSRFFEFSPREADITDPQQRIFLEVVWEALERAGYNPGTSAVPIGVYAGAGANGYLLHNLSNAGHLMGTVNAFQAVIHNKNDHLATRVAYKLNLKGPAVTVQTACSTSLTAIYHACQSLLSHQCDMALAGGVTITVPQKTGYLYNERGIGSPDGHCRPFDANAQGTVGASGAGVVVLKRLADAVADGDHIHAVIRGGALNNDGSDKVGYTAPSVAGQAEVISMAQAVSGVEPDSITYVEAHGTGTPMGDPIEVKALTQAFRQGTDRKGFCALGSVKSNLGHLDTAAGVAGVIKTVLALEHKKLPPSLHFEKPNPEIDFENSPFFVNAKLSDWNPSGPRRAGVSSFGLGGTNAHIILEEAPPRAQAPSRSREHQLLVLSARSDAALETITTRLAEHLEANPSLELADVAHTLFTGRKAFDHRRIVVCRDTKDAAEALKQLSPERVFSRIQEPVNRPLYFMFPGQGSQHPGMAAGLYASEAVFREELDRCLEHLARRHELDLRSVIFPADPADTQAAKKLEQTALTQPALFAVEYALAKLLMSWGLRPSAMIGHSVGEYVAACLAGVFSLEDALDLVATRGRLMQSCPTGAMLSVPRPEQEVAELLGPGLEIAAVNGPMSCVVAGPHEAIDALERRLAGQDVVCRKLRTSHAFHTSMMDAIVAPFREAVARTKRQAPALRFASNLTGTWITPEQAMDPDYWARHLRQAVRFSDGLDELLKHPEAALLEVGPGQALRTLARWHPRKKPGQFMMATLPPPQERASDVEFLLRSLGHLWLVGVETPGLFAAEQRRRLELPTYPFERQKHWVELRAASRGQGAQRGSLEKRPDVSNWFYLPVWKESAPAHAVAPVAGKPEAPWVILRDSEGLGEKLAARLRQRGAPVIDVVMGKAFRRAGPTSFEVNPARREDYAALLSELKAAGQTPGKLVHLFGITPGSSGAPGAAASEDVVARSFHSMLFLAQALGGLKLEQPVGLFCVSNGMQEVTGGDLTWPEQATVLGPIRVIPREAQQVRCRGVDVVLPTSGVQSERLVELLVKELTSEAQEPVVALRNARRWVQDFEEYRLEGGPDEAAPVREGGVYLITGGLGGMGLTFAEELAGKLKAKLVLTGRTELPPRDSWQPWLKQHGPEDATSRRIRAIQRMEQHGAEVLVLKADTTDAERMRAVVAEGKKRFGALHGVIHAAGVPGGGLLQLRTREAVETVLAPKVKGTQVLAAALEGEPLDFFVTCSSLSSVVGRLGQVDYTAANAFQDAFMRAWQARTGTYAVAINWGAWDEVGMAARPGANKSQEKLEGTPTGHPMLQRCLVDTPDKLVFATSFDIHSQWVVDEHRIVGQPAVPGVTYFEMVRAALEPRAQGRVIELQDIFFLAPLRVPEDESREVRITLEKDGDGYRWTASSQHGEAKPTNHVMGRARITDALRSPRTVDLEEIRARCNRKEPVSFEVEHEEDLGPRWRTVKNIHLGHNELLLVMEMPSEFSADFEKLKMHPALLDRASGMAKGSLGERGFYLPLGYKTLRIHGELPAKLYSHARYREAESPDRETMLFDYTLIDEQGRVLLEAERMMQKRVNDPGEQIRAVAAAARAASSGKASGDERQEILPGEGFAALERILGARVAPQVVVSVRDLQATIAQTDEVIRERVLEATSGAQPAGEQRARPNLKTGYVAPRNDLEKKIAEAWQLVLGVDKIGVDDNFFDLGGDSVQAIQIIAKGNQLGLQLNPQQFFQYSTIAELSEALGGTMGKQVDQGPVVGPVPLTPDQRRFFESSAQPPVKASRTVRVETRGTVDTAAVREALNLLLAHHDALRLRFSRSLSGWQQAGAAPGDQVPVMELDLASMPQAEHAPALHGAEEKLRAKLELPTGPLLAATVVRRGTGTTVLLAGHELAVDGASWRLLVEDLAAVLRQGKAGLRPKTLPFKQWAERLVEETSSEAVRKESASWLEGAWADVRRLPTERNGSEAGLARLHEVKLSAEETRALMERVTNAYRAEPSEALLTALAQSLAKWTGGQTLLVDVINDGRQAFEGLDFSRTVGRFDVTWPLLLEARDASQPAELLKTVKERVRRVPRKGIGYGLLLEEDKVRALPKAEVAFRHLGGEWELGAEPGPLASATLLPGEAGGSRLPNGRLLELESFVIGGQLHVRFRYDGGTLGASGIERLSAGLQEALRALSAEGQDTRAALTSVDFPLAGLDDSQLGALAAMIEQADGSDE